MPSDFAYRLLTVLISHYEAEERRLTGWKGPILQDGDRVCTACSGTVYRDGRREHGPDCHIANTLRGLRQLLSELKPNHPEPPWPLVDGGG